jgi:hypothetical protein
MQTGGTLLVISDMIYLPASVVYFTRMQAVSEVVGSAWTVLCSSQGNCTSQEEHIFLVFNYISSFNPPGSRHQHAGTNYQCSTLHSEVHTLLVTSDKIQPTTSSHAGWQTQPAHQTLQSRQLRCHVLVIEVAAK